MDNNHKNKHHRYMPPQIEVKGDKEVLNRTIDTLGLPEDTFTLLKNNKFCTIYDIVKRSERDMFRVQTFNKKHLMAVKTAIEALGLEFVPYVPYKKKDSYLENMPPENANNKKQNAPQQKINQNQAQNKNAKQTANQQNQQGQKQNKQPKQICKQNNKTVAQKPVIEKKPRVELPLEQWEKVEKDGKWGYSNGLKIVIQPRFDEVFCFKDGVACVEENEKFGYINEKGEYVIEPKFECAMSFSEGMAVFFEGEKCGYINKNGDVIISAKYDAATAFENGRAKVKEFGKWSTIAADGSILWTK